MANPCTPGELVLSKVLRSIVRMNGIQIVVEPEWPLSLLNDK